MIERYPDPQEYQATLLLLGFKKVQPKDGNPYDMSYAWMEPPVEPGRFSRTEIIVSGNAAGTMVTIVHHLMDQYGNAMHNSRAVATPFSGFSHLKHVLNFVKMEREKIDRQRGPDTGGT